MLMISPARSLRLLFVLAGMTVLAGLPAGAAITLFAEYHLGEAGSLGAENLPQDSSGNARHFVSPISGGVATVGIAEVYAPGSTAYLDTSGDGNEGWYSSGLFNTLPSDNFAFGVFARAPGLGGPEGDVFTVGGSNGSLKMSLAGNGWAASAHGIAWIAGDNGVSGSFTPNTWVHLALIRSAGSTQFYIDGVAQGSPYGGTPVNDSPHLSVSPGGGSYFDGQLDEARVVTFTAGQNTDSILSALQVPEPAAALFGSLGLLVLLRRRVRA